MVDFILSLLLFVAVGCLLLGVFKGLEQIATHMRGNPEAAKAVFEHIFMPLFSGAKEPERKTLPGTAMAVSKSSAEPTKSD